MVSAVFISSRGAGCDCQRPRPLASPFGRRDAAAETIRDDVSGGRQHRIGSADPTDMSRQPNSGWTTGAPSRKLIDGPRRAGLVPPPPRLRPRRRRVARR